MGAIETGRTICGALFGGAIFHGFLRGENKPQAPKVGDKGRAQAIDSVRGLFKGFQEEYGDTDCRTLTGCDFGKKEDVKRYVREEVYKDKCFHYVEYVLANCIDQMKGTAKPPQEP
jgi:hypothetical protein